MSLSVCDYCLRFVSRHNFLQIYTKNSNYTIFKVLCTSRFGIYEKIFNFVANFEQTAPITQEQNINELKPIMKTLRFIWERIPLSMRVLPILLLFALSASGVEVTWSYRIADEGTDHPSLHITATIPAGVHLYAQDNPQSDFDGATPLSITVTPTEGCELIGTPAPTKSPVTEYDASFEMNQKFFTGSVTFVQKLKPTAATMKMDVKIRGQFCTDSACQPVRESKSVTGKGKAAAKAADKEEPASSAAEADATGEEEAAAADDADPLAAAVDSAAMEQPTAALTDGDTWANVEPALAQYSAGRGKKAGSSAPSGMWAIFIAGLLAGFIALLTPCVWPMIPMTVSLFLKQNKTRAKGIRMAVLYGVSIIVIYVALGLLVTVIFGAAALNNLATNAIFNIIFFLLLVVFAISFFGGFEITLPSSWSNKMSSNAGKSSGLMGIFFMAFTLSLVSFSCTGPIIGTLLVEAASSGNLLSPAVGMFGFALALALPFTLFAMFPTMLNSMPKSGGWLNSVKVVLGFLELALSLKFLSVADMAYGWRILDREVFVALWIVIFALLGIYLLGKLRFPHDSKKEHTGVTSFMLALISLAFAVYMLPGLWGAPLKAISAFAPPLETQDFNLYEGEVKAVTNDYDIAIQMGATQNKPVLVDFSGYGCVNCRKMEGAVWTNDSIRDMLENRFVLATLYVDDKRALPAPIKKTDRKGNQVDLETYGDLWSFLQENKFGALAQPFHVILDAQGNPLTYSQDFTESTDEYKEFLNSALKNVGK